MDFLDQMKKTDKTIRGETGVGKQFKGGAIFDENAASQEKSEA